MSPSSPSRGTAPMGTTLHLGAADAQGMPRNTASPPYVNPARAASVRETVERTPMSTPIVCAIEKKTAEAVVETGGQLARELGLPVVLAYVGQVPARNSPDRRQRVRGWVTHQGDEILRRAHEFVPDGV